MSSGDSQRTALMALLGQKLAGEQAIKTVLFQQAIADQLGLNTTDLICLSFLSGAEPQTAGQLAEATGLTTGSVTIMIDRLEKAGYVQRDKDPSDRRRVLVRPIIERIERDIAPLYGSIAEAWERAIEGYSNQELAVILDMLTRSIVVLQEQTAALRQTTSKSPAPVEKVRSSGAASDSLAQPIRLLFANGAANLTLRGVAQTELYQAHFEPPEPHLQIQGNTVQIQYPRFLFFQRKRGTGTILLNNAPSWHIEVRGGSSTCHFDLQDLVLSGLGVFDGAFRLELILGYPRGVVTIKIASGAADVTIRRPPGAATQLVIATGVNVQFDDRYAKIVTERTHWHTPNYTTATDRYEISVEEGASNLSVVCS